MAPGRSTHLKYIEPSWFVIMLIASTLGVAGCAASNSSNPSPLPAAQTTAPVVTAPPVITTHLHILIASIVFPSFTCRTPDQDPCRGLADSTDAATASSNIAGDGTLAGTLVVDVSDPGPEGRCNTVDEKETFTFPAGSISIRSWHRDCNWIGPRIQTVFVITGGTGTFAGATGYGTERDDAPDGFAYDGAITYPGTPAPPAS
jgi:hypothetical protein